jgi:glycosyltransferase involved in cell wall biosynthesis
VRDSVVDGETGVLVDDDAAFAAEWIRLARDGDARRRLSEAASARAAELTWERAVSGFEAVLHEALSR